jgi:hypothetical protein
MTVPVRPFPPQQCIYTALLVIQCRVDFIQYSTHGFRVRDAAVADRVTGPANHFCLLGSKEAHGFYVGHKRSALISTSSASIKLITCRMPQSTSAPMRAAACSGWRCPGYCPASSLPGITQYDFGKGSASFSAHRSPQCARNSYPASQSYQKDAFPLGRNACRRRQTASGISTQTALVHMQPGEYNHCSWKSDRIPLRSHWYIRVVWEKICSTFTRSAQ